MGWSEIKNRSASSLVGDASARFQTRRVSTIKLPCKVTSLSKAAVNCVHQYCDAAENMNITSGSGQHRQRTSANPRSFFCLSFFFFIRNYDEKQTFSQYCSTVSSLLLHSGLMTRSGCFVCLTLAQNADSYCCCVGKMLFISILKRNNTTFLK